MHIALGFCGGTWLGFLIPALLQKLALGARRSVWPRSIMAVSCDLVPLGRHRSQRPAREASSAVAQTNWLVLRECYTCSHQLLACITRMAVAK